jgi:hypothetical protein
MAAKTPDSIIRESMGSLTAHIATFVTNDIDNDDTWESGIQNIVWWSATAIDDPTQTKEGIDVSLSGSTFTFRTGEDNREGKVLVLSKS